MFATVSLALLALSIATPTTTPPTTTTPSSQQPGDQGLHDVLANYMLRGKPATISRTDVALEMAFHLRRRDRGRQTCEILVDTLVTRREAERLGLMPSDAEVRQFWQKLKEQLRAAGRRPEDFPAVRNTGEQQWLSDLSVQIAQERLVRRELGIGEREKVGGDMLKLWLSETRKQVDVVTDPDLLPIGTAARVDTTSVPLIDLGLLLLRTSEDHERDRYIRQVALLESIEALASDESVRVTPVDLDQAVEKRRRQAENDPSLRGVKFENLLEAEGLTIASLRTMRVFRSYVLLDKVAAQRFSDQSLQAELAGNRVELLRQVGPRRRIGAIFVRALEDPNALILRTFEMADKHLEKVRRRIATDGFAATASIESEDGGSKRGGGDVGWHRGDSDELPAEVIKAAFALPLAEVSMPIRTADGCYLVTVLDKEPMPSDTELLRRLRTLRTAELRERLLREADVEIIASGAGKQREQR